MHDALTPRSLPFIAATVASLLLAPAGAATMSAQHTFSGVVSRVSIRSITVNDGASHRALSLLIVPTDGSGVLSPSGKTTYQMSAIKVGWHVKVDYDTTRSGQRHADHIFVLRGTLKVVCAASTVAARSSLGTTCWESVFRPSNGNYRRVDDEQCAG